MWLYWSPPTLADGLVREVVAAHVRSLQVDHLTDVASADTHTLKPWLSDKLAFAPPVIDLAPQGFQLLGARLDYLNDRAVAAVVYRRRQHRINLWIAPAGPAAAMAAALATRHGYHVLHWVHADMSYWAVSDLNQEELSYSSSCPNGAGGSPRRAGFASPACHGGDAAATPYGVRPR